MNIKTCLKCGFVGDEDLFKKNTNICKKCISKYNAEWNKNNPDKVKKNKIDWNKKNPEKVKEQNKKGGKKHYNKNSKEINKKTMEWAKKNPDKVLKNNNKCRNNKRKNNPSFRLKESCGRSINAMLKSQGASKAGKSCKNYLPFKQEELTPNIESKFEYWMNWGNQGNYKLKTWVDEDILSRVWNLDHIIPQSFLPYSSMKDKNFRILWDLANLRPLSAKQNVLDNNRRAIIEIKNEQEFKDITRLIFLLDEIINDEGIKPELIELYHNFIKVVNEYKTKANIK